MRPLAGLVCVPLIFACRTASAQAVTVRGVVYDSLHARPLAGAFVSIGTKTATADSLGRFAISGVNPGDYRLAAQHDAIDRIGMSAVGAQVRVTDGREPVSISIPSFATLWKLVCGATPPAADTGFVFGTVRSRRALRNPTVSVSWIDLAATGTRISQKLRTLEVAADPAGNFALCGVPTSTGLTVHAAADSAESGKFDIGPLDDERVVRRDLTLGLPVTATIAAGRGASITGRVFADSGRIPVANAELTLTDLGLTATTNERGEYAFKDVVPGSHRIYARKIGLAEVEFGIDVDEADHRERDIVMNRITLLDSMSVTGKFMARDEEMRVFEEHRKLGLGKFLTIDDLDKVKNTRFTTLLRQWPGVYIPPKPPWPQTKRGIKSILGGGACPMTIYLDGQKLDPRVDADIDQIIFPEQLGGVEYYPGPASTPPEYARLNSQCGVIVLHSRYKVRK